MFCYQLNLSTKHIKPRKKVLKKTEKWDNIFFSALLHLPHSRPFRLVTQIHSSSSTLYVLS